MQVGVDRASAPLIASSQTPHTPPDGPSITKDGGKGLNKSSGRKPQMPFGIGRDERESSSREDELEVAVMTPTSNGSKGKRSPGKSSREMLG